MLGRCLEQCGNIYGRTVQPEIYTNKAKRNLFVCFRRAIHTLYGMASCFGNTGITFDAKNDRSGPGSLQGHFEACPRPFLRLKAIF